jgi:ABC-type polysaccharide/polyol phosphate export permease
MDIAGMVKRTKGIVLAPKQEWPIIAAVKAGHAKVLLSWLLPLSLIQAVAAVIGFGLIGYAGSWGRRHGLLQVATMIGGAYVTAFIVNTLAESYASVKNQDQAFALIAYSYTPAALGGIFQLIPSLAIIGTLAGLYGLYLLYIGLPFLMKTPPEKNTGYFVVALLCTIGVFLVLSAVLAAVFITRMY